MSANDADGRLALPLPPLTADLPDAQDAPLISLWISTKLSPETQRAYTTEIARFRAFRGKPLARVTLADLQAFSGHLAQAGLKTTSQNRALTAIKSLLSFGHETGYLPFNVGAALKLRPSRDLLPQRILDEAEVARLIEAAPEGRDRVLLRLLYVAGIRAAEVCRLAWGDALPRQDGGQITVFGKGGRTRSILLKPAAWYQLAALRPAGAAPESAVFRSRKTGGRLDTSQIRRIVYAAARKAGIAKNVSPHWLRHAHASHALDHAAPIHLVQATLGHASISTTGRYLHARPSESSSLYLPD